MRRKLMKDATLGSLSDGVFRCTTLFLWDYWYARVRILIVNFQKKQLGASIQRLVAFIANGVLTEFPDIGVVGAGKASPPVHSERFIGRKNPI